MTWNLIRDAMISFCKTQGCHLLCSYGALRHHVFSQVGFRSHIILSYSVLYTESAFCALDFLTLAWVLASTFIKLLGTDKYLPVHFSISQVSSTVKWSSVSKHKCLSWSTDMYVSDATSMINCHRLCSSSLHHIISCHNCLGCHQFHLNQEAFEQVMGEKQSLINLSLIWEKCVTLSLHSLLANLKHGWHWTLCIIWVFQAKTWLLVSHNWRKSSVVHQYQDTVTIHLWLACNPVLMKNV